MRRVLLDEGVPVGVRQHIVGFSVETVAEVGWAGLTNGDLIAAAEAAEFDIMVPADQNIRYQQNLTERKLALVVLETNHWSTIHAHWHAVLEAVSKAGIGTYTTDEFPRPSLRRRPFIPKRVLSQNLRWTESGQEDCADLSRQRIELVRWAQLSCLTQLTFTDHVYDLDTREGDCR
jgi:hypothetical protein